MPPRYHSPQKITAGAAGPVHHLEEHEVDDYARTRSYARAHERGRTHRNGGCAPLSLTGDNPVGYEPLEGEGGLALVLVGGLAARVTRDGRLLLLHRLT